MPLWFIILIFVNYKFHNEIASYYACSKYWLIPGDNT